MSGNIVKDTDLFDPALSQIPAKALKEIQQVVDSLTESFKQMKAASASIAINPLQNSGDINKQLADMAKYQKAKNDIAAQELKAAKIASDSAKQKQKEDKQAMKDAEDKAKAEAKYAKELEKSIGTINNLVKANRDLIKERNQLDLTTASGKKRLEEINKEIDKNNNFIKENSSSLERQRMNVGNYTESIEKALSKTTLFGEAIETVNGIYEAINEILEIFKERQEAAAAASEAAAAAEAANAAATEVDTVAKESNVVITEKEVDVKAEDVVATEAETVATEENTAANKANTLSKMGVVGAIILGVAAIGALTVAYIKSTQAGKDELEVDEELTKMALTQAGTIVKYGSELRKLMLQEKELHDERVKHSIEIQALETKAQKARAAAMEEKTEDGEINTTQNKITLLNEFISLTKKAFDLKKADAELDYKNAQRQADIFKGTGLQREYADKAAEAKNALEALGAEEASETRRTLKMIATLNEKYNEDLKNQRQKAAIEEIQAIRITATEKLNIIQQTLQKQTLLENQKFKNDLEDLKEEQAKRGALKGQEAEVEKENMRAIEALTKDHKSKLWELQEKSDASIVDEMKASYKRDLDAFNKYNDEMDKAQTEAIENEEKRLLAQAENKRTIAIRNANAQDTERVDSHQDPAKSKELLDAELLAIDAEYLRETDKIYTDANNKKIETVNKFIHDYEKAFETAEKHLEINLLNSNKSKEDIEKKLRDKRIEDLKTEIAERQQLNQDATDKELELAKLKYDKEKALKKEVAQQAEQVEDFTKDALTRTNDAKQKALDNDLQMQQNNILQQEQLAAEGRKNSLAQAEADAAKDELAKQQLAIKEQKQAKALALFNMIATAATKEQPLQALATSLAAMAIATAVAGSAYEGIEDTGGAGEVDNKGGKTWVLHPHERVLSRAHNEMIGDLTNEELAKIARNYNEGVLPPYITNTGNSFAENVMNSELVKQFKQLKNEIEEFKQIIKERPVPTLNIDKDGIVSKREFINGLARLIINKNRSNYI